MIRKEIKSFVLSAGEYADMQCRVPATLCSALIENGYISSAFEENNGSLVPVPHPASCTFVAKIDFSETEAARKHVYIRLKRILARCEILFNGRSYGIIGNVNAVSVFDVTDKVHAGENILEIKCTESVGRRNYIKRNGDIFDAYVTAPKLSDIGILDTPELLISDGAVISNVKTEQKFDNGKADVFVRTDILGDEGDLRVVASLVSPSGKIYFGGACEGGVIISVSDPELWWPNGYGAQRLYKLSVTLYRGSDALDSYERKIGLRKLEFKEDENGVERLFVNDVRVYPRGAAYLTPKSILSDVKKTDIEKLISRAVEMNFNTLSVFDEGVAPSEEFFELCDKAGIMVWQSLSIPYVAPPAAGVFASGLSGAISDTVAMLSEHPSVAVAFLAINEANLGMARLFPDAVEEFRSVCLKIIEPITSGITNFFFEKDMEKMLSFDERYSTVLNSDTLYTSSIPCGQTLREFLSEEEYNLFSKTAEAHTASREDCMLMLDRTFSQMRFPMGMAELAYSTQAATAYSASENIRLARCTDIGCRSAIFRQLNDGAYMISPSLVDYGFRRKASCYKLADAYGQVVVSSIPRGKEIKVYICNDSKKEYKGKLLLALYDTRNKCWYENTRPIKLSAAESVLAAEEDFSKFIDDPGSYYLIYELFTESRVTDNGTVRFVPLKHFKFRSPEIKYEITGMGKSFTLKMTSSSYIAGVEVSFSGVEAEFSDNLVDILPINPTVISFTVDSAISPEELQSRFVIRTPESCGK